MKDGFIKVAAYSPRVAVADPTANAATAIDACRRAEQAGAKLLVLPELFLSGYTCGDLFFQTKLLADCEQALTKLLAETADTDVLTLIGIPFAWCNRLYNCVAVLHGGRLLGILPKTNIPDYKEFSEGRYFCKGPAKNVPVRYCGFDVLFGAKQIFTLRALPAFRLAAEICEDVWVPIPPCSAHTAAGATVIANLSASDEQAGKAAYRRALLSATSARHICGYVYSSSGAGESTTDLVFSGNNFVFENGNVLAESAPFAKDSFTVSEIDCEKLQNERRKITSYTDASTDGYAYIEYGETAMEETVLTRPVDPHPFIPASKDEKNRRCERVLEIQAHGLAHRIEAAHA
ncbi:MAG: NAD(+) synthase, partial [Clostridia bacterium]|nr:NAD(+) synthase [Clostridia bacterium]